MKGNLMKKLILIAAALLVLITLVPAMIACDGGEAETTLPETTETVPETTEAPTPEPIKLTDGNKPLYTIVRPDESDSVFEQTKKLAEILKSATGVDFKNTTDFIGWNTVRDPEAYEILLGFTNYDETAEVMKDLKYFDYAVVVRGHKIIITAYTDSSLKKAVNYFRDNIIPLITKGEDGSCVIEAFADEIYRGKYNIDTVTLDGNPLQNYTVVYGKGTPAGEAAALKVVEVLATATGIYLPMTDDKTAETECEILVGSTNRAASAGSDSVANMCYNVSLQSGKLVLDCRSLATAEAAVRKLYASKMSSGANIELTSGQLCEGTLLKETEFPMTAGSDIRIVTYNVLTEKWGGTETSARSEVFGAFLDVYKPDVVGVQELCEKWRKYLPAHLGDYKLIGTVREDKGFSYSAIVYDASKYEVLAQG